MLIKNVRTSGNGIKEYRDLVKAENPDLDNKEREIIVREKYPQFKNDFDVDLDRVTKDEMEKLALRSIAIILQKSVRDLIKSGDLENGETLTFTLREELDKKRERKATGISANEVQEIPAREDTHRCPSQQHGSVWGLWPSVPGKWLDVGQAD